MSRLKTGTGHELINMPRIRALVNSYLRIPKSPEDERLTVEGIKSGVVFKGATLWILIFAIFVASLGLNVNSTAVIIGAMLISPLMGPIMGVGLSVGIGDFDLLKKSLKNLLVATIFSVLTSTLYFYLTPIDEAQSELLARTSPTIYDVMIAFFGGFAGIVALFTKDKGNVIPGVAIATALMPPLCTAGFGLATGDIYYFLGAFYLYFINSVFISLATYIGVRVMKFKKLDYANHEREKKVKKYILIVAVITMSPAIYLTYGLVKKTIYTTAADNFVTDVLDFKGTLIIEKSISYEDKRIQIVLIGKEVTNEQIAIAKDQLKKYKLLGTSLVVLQGFNQNNIDVGTMKSMIMEDFYRNSEQRLIQQQSKIDSLQKELNVFSAYNFVKKNVGAEIKVLYPEVTSFAFAKTIELSVDSAKADTVTLALLNFKKVPSKSQQNKISDWIKARLNAKRVKLIIK